MNKIISFVCLSALAAAVNLVNVAGVVAVVNGAAPEPTAPVAEAAMHKDAQAVRSLLRQGGDVNAAQGDGMTALHWAAMQGDADLAGVLLYAGANVRATTRLGGYTPLHLASQSGSTAVINALVAAGAAVGAATATGATPLMLAASAGQTDAVKTLLDHHADPNTTESANGETALMFAAALDRAEVARVLLQHGAIAATSSKVVDLAKITAPEDDLQREIRDKQNAESAARTGNAPLPPEPGAFQAPTARDGVAGATRPYAFNELIGKQGGLTALHFATRQGAMRTAQTLVESGADVNVATADGTTALVMAAINGQFDLAKYLLDHGANPNIASQSGMTALYGALNLEWAPRMFYPQPRAQLQQQITYLDFMKALLDKGADVNARVRRKIWYTQYNFDLLRVDETGATPFWRAAYASDIAAMKLLLEYGADPNIATMKPPVNNRFQQGGTRSGDASRDGTGRPPVPTGGPDIPPLVAAAGSGYGEGFAANAHRFAPTGMLEAVKFLVEEIHVDVNAQDADGNTALHNAAARGDNDMILYLVSKGADVKAVNRTGQTTVDMANGPVQRTQPYPETIKLLEGLGAKNNHRCVSC
ncbi:MAG TPA: ankyrin repeat domain-containing protein [Vicinamibacterales bacterium]|jgi:ankyrin repeat protein|nr:ankyrin repeat domain-containing protein [Vicinamibacterales bacterium]